MDDALQPREARWVPVMGHVPRTFLWPKRTLTRNERKVLPMQLQEDLSCPTDGVVRPDAIVTHPIQRLKDIRERAHVLTRRSLDYIDGYRGFLRHAPGGGASVDVRIK